MGDKQEVKGNAPSGIRRVATKPIGGALARSARTAKTSVSVKK